MSNIRQLAQAIAQAHMEDLDWFSCLEMAQIRGHELSDGELDALHHMVTTANVEVRP